MKELNPSLEKTFQVTAEQIILSENFITSQLQTILTGLYIEDVCYVKIKVRLIHTNKNGLFLLNAILKNYGFTFADSKSIFQSANSSSGKLFTSPLHRLIKDRDFWIIEKNSKAISESILIFLDTQEVVFPENSRFCFMKFSGGLNEIAQFTNENTLLLDFDKIIFPFKIRKWKIGDKFSPLGVKGTKLVSDYLIDLKLNLFEKERALLIESDGLIAGIFPTRPSNYFSITKNTTSIYRISVLPLFA